MRENKKVKLKDLQLLINDEVVDVPMRIDITNGRVQFRKVKMGLFRGLLKDQTIRIIRMLRMMIAAHNAQPREKKDCPIL